MKASLLLMSHGRMAQEMLASAQMIAGEIPNAQVVCMMDNDGLAGAQKMAGEALAKWNDGRPLLIMVDLMGGTPSNVAAQEAAQRPNTALVAGVNLGMVVEYALSDIEDLDALAAHVAEAGQGSISVADIPHAGEGAADDEEIELDE